MMLYPLDTPFSGKLPSSIHGTQPAQTSANVIQSDTTFQKPEKLSDGTSLQAGNYDTFQLTEEQSEVTLNVPEEMTHKVPRKWTIMLETIQSKNQQLTESLAKADSMNLSFGDRLTFLKEEGEKWVSNVRENDPEMFVAWLKLSKDHIEEGRSDLAGLPSDFTMEDYYSYVKDEEPYSVLA